MKIENPKFSFEVIKRFLHIPARSPNRVQIEITNKCNLDCKMCPRKFYGVPYENMSFSFFKEMAPKLAGVNLILPVGWGESFVHPDVDKIIDYLKSTGHEIKVASNGLLLNNDKAINTALKIDFLTFSLDELREENGKGSGHPHSSSEIVNIRRLIEERKRRGLKKPFIAIQAVVYKANEDILKIIRLAKELGVDRVNLVRPYTKFDKSFLSSWQERKEIYKKAEKLGKELGIRVDMFEYATFSGIKRLLWKYFKWIFRINDWCPRLYDFAYVTMDGAVTPCCALPRYIVGDLKKESLKQIWKGEKMNYFRKHHKEICKDCPVFKIIK